MQFHNHFFQEGEIVILAEVFFHNDELEVTHYIITLKAFVAAGDIHFFVGNQVGNNLPEHQVYLGFHPESKAELHPNDVVWNNMFNNMAAFPNLTAFGSGNASAIQPLSSGVDYTITYTIQRTAADTNVITASIAGSDLTAYQAQATDTSAINTSFDSFALRWSGNAFTSSACSS